MTTVVILIIVFAFFGAPIFSVLACLAVIGATLAQPDATLAQAFAGALVRVFHIATAAEGATFATIPLFTFMGYVLAESKTADRLVAWAQAVFGWVPGGLAIVTVVVCAVFTTVTGASGVTIVAVGGLVMPALIKQGYPDRFSLGLVTSTGSIGLLFPPALPLIIFGIIYGVTAQALASAGGGETMGLSSFDLQRFLLAGILPGTVLISAFALYSVYVAIRNKVPRTSFEIGTAIRETGRALPELLIPFLMIAALKLGLTIPEAAAITCMYVVILECLIFRDVKLRMLPRISREAMQLVGAIFILIVSATALTDFFVLTRLPDKLTAWMIGTIHSKYLFLAALNLFLLAVGFVMEIFTALLVVVPLIAPVAIGFGINPYHLGVIFLLNLEVGYIHPPVGLNLFISSFRFRKPMVDLYWSVIPFLVIMLITLMVVTYVPGLSTWVDKAKPAEKQAKGGGGAEAGLDAGVVVKITLPDGGVITPEYCDRPEIKGDSLAYADCQSMFKLWARCEGMAEELDRIECRDKVLSGEDPFAADAGH
jgi:C4-dicarboxylate transporter, DctM subunit